MDMDNRVGIDCGRGGLARQWKARGGGGIGKTVIEQQFKKKKKNRRQSPDKHE